MEYPTIPTSIEVGDFVQARLHATTESEQPPLVTEFTVSAITGTVYDGGPAALAKAVDTSSGWELALIRKGDPGLPTGLARVAAILTTAPAHPVKLLGSGTDWQLDGGGHIDCTQVIGWMLWTAWAPLVAAYEAWEAEQVTQAEAIDDTPVGPIPGLPTQGAS
ncbi:hypothetical protein [Glaciihabitans sp. dw_435]|uniref:hypothetical protein n=1 Tax=Glaciihabitans sp. dw_435 TaxID=2720081 RepID=UPI001BD21C30|nr:hypothetical protein [Glaciihabitans sp. dw_435]